MASISVGVPFEHTLIRKYIIAFGTIFNDIVIGRSDGANNQAQYFKVPIEYSPKEKMLAITQAKPTDQKKRAIQLPRMGFELTNLQFDVTRKLERRNIINIDQTKTLRGAPWNLQFQLNVMTKNALDGTKIIEQALFYFQPDYVVDIKMLDGFDHSDRIPIVFNNIGYQDVYDNDFMTRRATIWSLDFTLKGWFYGPISEGKQIKFIDLRYFGSDNANSFFDRVTIQPGLTANGEPTSNVAQTIDYLDIDQSDDWGIIEQYYEQDEGE